VPHCHENAVNASSVVRREFLEGIMVALLVGIVSILITVFVCLPSFLGWWPNVVEFLKGGVPVLTAFIGVIAVFIGAADIKDKAETKKEENKKKAADEKK
jgi:hypothetical protein